MKAVAWSQWLGRYSVVRRRHRYAALAAVPLVVLALAYVFFFSDQQSVQAGLAAEIANAAQQRADKEAYLVHAKAYGEQLHGLEGELRAAHVVLPDNPEVPQFLAQLGTMAHDIGLTIERFEPKAEVPRDFYAELPFRVQVRGSFHQVAMFAAQIGAMERIVNVSNLTLGMGKLEVHGPSVDGAFDVKVFRLLSEAQLTQMAKDAKQEAK